MKRILQWIIPMRMKTIYQDSTGKLVKHFWWMWRGKIYGSTKTEHENN